MQCSSFIAIHFYKQDFFTHKNPLSEEPSYDVPREYSTVFTERFRPV